MRISKPILGPDGRPYRNEATTSTFASQYDVARTNEQNSEHWGWAGIGDANVAYDQSKRTKSRDRARYEVANNCHLRGMVNTKAQDTIGCGPNLQMRSEHQEIERSWRAWAEETRFSEKLVALWGAGKIQDGEAIGLLVESDAIDHEVPLDVMGFESEQMGNPFAMADTIDMYDGIRHDRGVPVEYYIYHEHPANYAGSGNSTAPYSGTWYDASRVIHVFRKNRLGQLRGATELGSALPLAAILRRYTMATLSSAEVAASISLWLETDGTPEDEPLVGMPFETMPVTRNQVVTAPYRWKIHQLRAEQPVDTYDKFLRAIVTQMGRSIGMPAALSYGDSSEYNMASGRLDYQDYIRGLEAERRLYLEPSCVDKVFFMWLRAYLAIRTGMSMSDFTSEELRKAYPHRWSYQPIHHSDPEKQAKADVVKYEAGHISLFDVLHAQNKDPDEHFRELEEQVKRLQKAGMPVPGVMPGMPGAAKSEKGSVSDGQTAAS